MNKVGTTSTGSVMVEMTAQQYEALRQLTKPSPSPAPAVTPSAKVTDAKPISRAEKIEHVKQHLKKLSPKKRESVVNSIRAMFQNSGGISQSEVDAMIKALQKSGYFTIATSGKVAYRV
ncbi:hypothetical protein RISK_002358 [Rhodopirellula islandica]|uniref:Uncharacterized protein n=1 Tax=Rhodopirellula islandica TaxID=595434 RepID=A0A0J1BGT1_RHOIS|nr:hypothetical protein [Rhodopirellula islandica]KLU05726.1 hypothetical protein RISK_002358 [Rhodopirellula islandica]